MAESSASLVTLSSFRNKIQCNIVAHCAKIGLSAFDSNQFSPIIFGHVQKSNLLQPGATVIVIVNCASGFGVATLARRHGYHVVAVVTEKHRKAEVAVLRAMSCDIVVGYSAAGPASCRAVAARLHKSMKTKSTVLDMELLIKDLPQAPFETIADEIISQAKAQNGELGMVAAYGPYWSKVLEIVNAKTPQNVTTINAQIDRSGEEDSGVAEGVFYVSEKDAFLTCRKLVEEDALMCGPTSAATIFAATQSAKSFKRGTQCLVILSDSIFPHTSTILDDHWMLENGFVSDDTSGNEEKWRGAAVEDVYLPQVITTTRNSSIGDVIEEMDDHDVDNVPVLNEKKRLVGLMNRQAIRAVVTGNKAALSDPVSKHMRTFKNKEGYTPIRMDTPLAEVEKFFNQHGPHADCPAFITDYNNWCLGVITKVDLLSFLSQRRV